MIFGEQIDLILAISFTTTSKFYVSILIIFSVNEILNLNIYDLVFIQETKLGSDISDKFFLIPYVTL